MAAIKTFPLLFYPFARNHLNYSEGFKDPKNNVMNAWNKLIQVVLNKSA